MVVDHDSSYRWLVHDFLLSTRERQTRKANSAAASKSRARSTKSLVPRAEIFIASDTLRAVDADRRIASDRIAAECAADFKIAKQSCGRSIYGDGTELAV